MIPLPPLDLSTLLGGLSPEEFLAQYWQKRPLLIRQAIPGFRSPLSPEELAGLACEDEVESRLVLEHGANGPWELRHGPFDERDFSALPESHWTLLVQDVDKHVPGLAELLAPFRFIPDWRIDDLMISFAAPAGSVGPHSDQYDVFLLQAYGRRRWKIQYPAPAEERLLPGLAMRILAEFDTSDEWVLEPGDMLYLPPGVPHYGIAEDACMTYSVGFRVPADRELAAAVAAELLDRAEGRPRYSDADRRPTERPGEITADALAALRTRVRDVLLADDEVLDRALCRFLTEPKPLFADKPAGPRWSARTLRERLAAGQTLIRNPASRFAFVANGEGGYLYVDGHEYPLSAPLRDFGARLADERRLGPLDPAALPAAALTLLHELLRGGHWEPET